MKEKITLEEHRKMLKKKADKISEIINGLAINDAIGLLVGVQVAVTMESTGIHFKLGEHRK